MSELLMEIDPDQPLQADDDAISDLGRADEVAGEHNSVSYSVRLIEETLQKVQDNFADCPNIAPVLCVGNSCCGRSAILESILQRCGVVSESIFASNERKQGVYVWPKPVRLESMNLLLLKMWGVDPDDPRIAFSNIVLSALLCTTSVCLVCTEKNNLLPTLDTIQSLYSEIHSATGLKVSQFVAFLESKAYHSKLQLQAKFNQLRKRAEAEITRYLYRGDRGISKDCAAELCNLLADSSLHAPFIESHQRLVQTCDAQNSAHSIALMLRVLVRIVNLDLSYRCFVANIPRFAEVGIEMHQIEELETRINRVRCGEVIEFLAKKGDSYTFDLSTFKTLHQNYDTEKPTIVIVFIGKPRMGKSTLLNHLIQASTGDRLCQEYFKIGRTTEHTTRASQVFSQKLSLGENQVMLIDLEGLEGLEIQGSENLGILQKKLKDAILTVASVPCILVRHEANDINFVEEVIKKIVELQKKFGFQTERIHLLFQDSDLNTGVNQFFAQFVSIMNYRYFENKTVLKLRNKPNFCIREKADMREEFLRDLLANSDFPKRSQSGSLFNIFKLLEELPFKALPLGSFSSPISDSRPGFEVSICKNTLTELQNNFQETFTPVLFVGKLFNNLEGSLPAEFINAQSEDSLMVWPMPFVIQGRNLLLMKMWAFNVLEEDEGKREALQRFLSALLSLSGRCVVGFDQSEIFHGLRFIHSFYGGLQARGLHNVSFTVLEPCEGGRQTNKSQKDGSLQPVPVQISEQVLNAFDKTLTFSGFIQSDVYSPSFEALLTRFVKSSEWSNPESFCPCVLDVAKCSTFTNMQSWVCNLQLAVRFANFELEKECFVREFPRFDEHQQQDNLQEFFMKQEMLNQASVRKFIERGRSPACKYTNFLDIPHTNFDPHRPTVVLTVIGEPGIGKSNFLNHLIQHAFHRRRLYPYFATGSVPRQRTTKDSLALICPLSLPGPSSQMLLIDLEGLVEAEPLSENEGLEQSNLISGVLAVASVPCFFVKNTNAHQQKQIEWYIERIMFLSSVLKFSCDRIFFLSNDQDFRRGEQSDNVQMNEWIDKLNKRFFDGCPVICLMNKPNFNDHSKAEMCHDFLETFLSNCNFPKNISVPEVLARIHSISQNSSTEQDRFPVDFANIDALWNEKVQYYRRKSELLCFIEPNPVIMQSSEKYSLQPVGEVMDKLHRNFNTCPEITPVLSIGNNNCGRSSILDSLLRRELRQYFDAKAILENFSNFASEGRPPGLYVWPYPVRLEGATLLLMKMWGVDFRESNKSLNALNYQMISALLCITSVCLVSTEKSALFHALESVQKCYREIRQALSLTISQFVVFAERNEQFASPESQEKLKMVQTSSEGPITRFLCRGNIGISESCCDELYHLLVSQDLHLPFLESHQNIQQNIKADSKAHSITQMLKILMRVMKLDLSYRGFVETIPRFAHAEFEQKLKELETFERYVNDMREAKALSLLVKDGDSYRFNDSVIEKLQINYDFEKPTIVLVIIGNPGFGKSTFLNRLIQMSTKSRRCFKFFQTGKGNSYHISTSGSQVLSHPLNLGGNQLMLIDLEGMDIHDRVQNKLLLSILRIASVPCILVPNDTASKKFIECAIKKLHRVRKRYGLPIARVHLLLCDRDVNPNGCGNEKVLQLVNYLNQTYFENFSVAKVRNKPSFNVSENAEMCEAFMKDLLADSNFPKRNESGFSTNISKLLLEMKFIMDCRSANLADIAYSREEFKEITRIETEKIEQLKKIAQEIISSEEDTGLIHEFERQYEEFKNVCTRQLKSQTERVRRHVMVTLENEASMQLQELSQIEYCYRAVRRLSAKEVWKAMKGLLLYFYRETWRINIFLERADELKLKLEKIKKRYPQEYVKLSEVLVKFEKKRSNLRNWFIVNYSFNIGTTVLSGGLGVAAKGATLAVTAGRLIGGAVVGGLTSLGRLVYSVTQTLILTDTAMELYNFAFISSEVHLNSKVSNLLQEDNNARLYVMAVLGTKKSMASNLLNEFVRQVLPFTPYSVQAFKDSELTQIIHCSYQHPDIEVESTNTHALLIYLRMKENMHKKKNERTIKLATEILMRIPLTCLFFDHPDIFANKMLDDASAKRRNWSNPLLQQKLLIIHSRESRRDDFFSRLESFAVPHENVDIGRFDEQGIKSGLLRVKKEFDNSTPISPSFLLEVLMNAEVTANS